MESGIRTNDTVARMPVLEADATSPHPYR